MGSLSPRDRRRLTTAVKESVRALTTQLSLLGQQVGARVDLKPSDFECLEIIQSRGPLSPTALARIAGLHPATLTGVLDRLQRGGWVVRERDPQAADRRAVTIRALRDRNHEIYQLYAPMNASMDGICEGFSEEELQVIADFLHRALTAGQQATASLHPSASRPTPTDPNNATTP